MEGTANGRRDEIGGGTAVDGFIRLRGLNPQLVVVELNGEALERARYGTELSDGDRLELVRAGGGGGRGPWTPPAAATAWPRRASTWSRARAPGKRVSSS